MGKIRIVSFLLFGLLLSSCGNSPKGKETSFDEIQEMVDNIIDAVEKEDFERQQLLCDDMYLKMGSVTHCKAEIWLSSEYFFLCCYNGGSEDDVKMKMELYTEKYLGLGTLWESVKDMDTQWFSNIERSAELIIRSYNENPSRTEKLINENGFEAYQSFARIVLRKK